MSKQGPKQPTDSDWQTPDDLQEDFAALFEASQADQKRSIHRDEQVEGTVVTIGSEWVFVDVGAKSEGAIAREELVDKSGQLSVKVGDRIKAYVVNDRDGEMILSVRITTAASEEALRSASRSGLPIEGLVTEERKGGFSVTIFGKQAFCPYSQIDLGRAGDPAEYVGQRFTFRITEYSEGGRNIVLSRREILEEERQAKVAKLKVILQPGILVRGVVQNLAKFGAFVDLGGVHGLIPMSELAWYRVQEASDVLEVGQEVEVKILDVDWKADRISLSLKQTLDDPWGSVLERYTEGTVLNSRITRLTNFGAFVELEPGIEGLIHISKLGAGRRINHPKEIVSEGEIVEIEILSIDAEQRRIGLELKGSVYEEESGAPVVLKQGEVVTGTVDSVKEYGVFVRLPGGKSGLLHVSEMDQSKSGDLRRRFPADSEIRVQIRAIDPDSGKISLSTKSLAKSKEKVQLDEFMADKPDKKGLGTFGDLLKDKLKK